MDDPLLKILLWAIDDAVKYDPALARSLTIEVQMRQTPKPT